MLCGIARASGKLPLALQNRPEPDQYLQYYIDAFIVLSDTRRPMESLAISDIFLYAKELGEDPIEFAKIIIEGDKAFLIAKQEKAELNGGNKKPS